MRDRVLPMDAAQLKRAYDIASRFDLAQPLQAFDFPGKGNINQQTYLITAGQEKDRGEFLLQLLNPGVFTQPDAVMNTMISCIRAQEKALARGIVPPGQWETIRLIRTKEGEDYLRIQGASGIECWRMMARIGDSLSFKSLREIPDIGTRLRVAEQAGCGLALFGVLTAGMNPSSVISPLPGYRDTELYYSQLMSVLAESRTLQECEPYLPSDPLVRESTRHHYLVRIDPAEYARRLGDPQLSQFINLAIAEQPFALSLIRKLKSGELRKVVVHGDTKLDNFLFNAKTGRAKALVDLDTIMPHTWLSDWGDMVRSLVNVAGEKEPDLERVDVDQEVFRALATGYLGSAGKVDPDEIDLMADAPRLMALELGVRFLADYLRGDSYFQLKPEDPPDLNKVRAMVQFRLFERLRTESDKAEQIIRSLAGRRS